MISHSRHTNFFRELKLKSINLSTHPYLVVSELLERYGNELEFEFSKYMYTPNSLFDEREIFSVRGLECCESLVIDLLNDLNDRKELALHSKVKKKNGKVYHIPMIDFSFVDDWEEEFKRLIRNILPRKITRDLVVFSSGRSYHGYSTCLITPKEWREFMGILLLLNAPGNCKYIDCRWIGHRLVGGYSSLRWSCNTHNYLTLPSRLKIAF